MGKCSARSRRDERPSALRVSARGVRRSPGGWRGKAVGGSLKGRMERSSHPRDAAVSPPPPSAIVRDDESPPPENEPMRYMLFIKHTEDYRGKTVPPALMKAMGEFVK